MLSVNAHVAEIAPVAQRGWSNARILKLTSDRGSFCIRGWSTDSDRVQAIERFQRAAYESFLGSELPAMFTRIPIALPCTWATDSNRDSSVLELNGRLWTLCEWIDAKPIDGAIDFDQALELSATIAAFHNATSHIGAITSSSQTTSERLQVVQRLIRSGLPMLKSSLALRERSLIEMCASQIQGQLIGWEWFLKIATSRTRHCHWIVRDLWRENILVDVSGRFAGIVDLGAARIDWPGFDLIRFLGSVCPLDELQYAKCVSAYQDASDLKLGTEHGSHQPLADLIAELRALHRIAIGLSIVQWIDWFADGLVSNQSATRIARAEERLTELCNQWLVERAMGIVM